MCSKRSHGDVFPFIGLASELEERGHQVCMFVPVNHLSVCTDSGIYALQVFSDTQQTMEKVGGLIADAYVLDPKTERKRRQQARDEWLQENPDLCVQFEEAMLAFNPEVIVIGNLVTSLTYQFEQKHAIPVIPFFLNRTDMENSVWTDSRYKEVPRPMFFAVSDIFDSDVLGNQQWPKRIGWMGGSCKAMGESRQSRVGLDDMPIVATSAIALACTWSSDAMWPEGCDSGRMGTPPYLRQAAHRARRFARPGCSFLQGHRHSRRIRKAECILR
jgi:hypothetical protein